MVSCNLCVWVDVCDALGVLLSNKSSMFDPKAGFVMAARIAAVLIAVSFFACMVGTANY